MHIITHKVEQKSHKMALEAILHENNYHNRNRHMAPYLKPLSLEKLPVSIKVYEKKLCYIKAGMAKVSDSSGV